MIARRAAVALILTCSGAFAQQVDDARAAFDAQDYLTAETLWLEDAQDGSVDALMGLALIYDRGLNGTRKPQAAFDLYLEAAQSGLAEAQFNVGVLLDAGIGTERDTDQAYIWYSRAALRGHRRAQYNLGLLLEAGPGEQPLNPGWSRYWFNLAAEELSAAAAKRDALIPTELPNSDLAPPDLALSQLGDDGLEVVLAVQPVPERAYFRLEAEDLPDTTGQYSPPQIDMITQGSAFLAATPEAGPALWRVSMINRSGDDYAATPWQGRTNDTPGPDARIRIRADQSRPEVDNLVSLLASDLRGKGFWVREDPPGEASLEVSTVSYGYLGDEAMARDIANFLPTLEPDAARFVRTAGLMPGEILIEINRPEPDAD